VHTAEQAVPSPSASNAVELAEQCRTRSPMWVGRGQPTMPRSIGQHAADVSATLETQAERRSWQEPYSENATESAAIEPIDRWIGRGIGLRRDATKLRGRCCVPIGIPERLAAPHDARQGPKHAPPSGTPLVPALHLRASRRSSGGAVSRGTCLASLLGAPSARYSPIETHTAAELVALVDEADAASIHDLSLRWR